MSNQLCILFLLFILYSFVGWVMEVFVTLHDTKKLVNRGFLVGPICPIYGCGVLLILLLLHKYLDDPVALFVMAILLCSFLEYFTGYIMEKLFNARWWDYSHKKFNINGRICLDNLVAFGVLGLLVMYILNPFFMKILNSINSIVLDIIAIILVVILLVDMIVSFKIIKGFKNVARSVEKDNTAEITLKVRELLMSRGGLYKRLVSAFNFEAKRTIIKEKLSKVKDSASKILETLEREKNKKIEKITYEYNKKIGNVVKKLKKDKNEVEDKDVVWKK